MSETHISVGFVDPKLQHDFLKLKSGSTQDKELYEFIDRATDDLKKDPSCGIKIPKDRWPKGYIKKFGVTNLWKYDLPNAWRLIYTIVGSKIQILAIVLEWMTHKEYERRFNY